MTVYVRPARERGMLESAIKAHIRYVERTPGIPGWLFDLATPGAECVVLVFDASDPMGAVVKAVREAIDTSRTEPVSREG